MNSKYLDKLEYNKILEMLEGFAKTYLGKNLCRRLHPSTNVSFLLEQTNQALGLIYKKGNLPLSSIPNIDIAIKNLESNFALTALDLLEIGSILKTSRELKEYFLDESCELILPSYDMIYINKLLEKEIFDKILDEKLEIVEKKLESKYGATLDLLNKQYKMIETLNSQNNVKLNEIIKKQNLILNEENKIKKFEKNVTFPQTATSFTIEGEEYEGSDENEQKIPFMNSQNNIFNNNVNHQNIHSMNQMMNQQCNPYMLLNLIQQVQNNSQLQMAQWQMLRNIQNQMLNPGNGNPSKEKLINNWFREGFNSTNTNFMSYSDENKNNYSENQKLETINQMNTNFNDENKKEDLEGFIEIGKKKNNNKHLKKLKNK